ncbi:pseudouridine synthase [Calocera viscosa TUFC12733]|uniref:tRNA pseudouridine(55) synthase n=1 Tax=Calocera viscosa (strain TUFC12733) TaxID=1330018 RepID=A0A167LLB9_CALVF|nr:pseudouridine synthase [Calocera viscosa TUFC12733]
MPKAALPYLPVPGALFAIAKPSGPPCMPMLDGIKPLINQSRLFNDPAGIEVSKQAVKKRRFKHRPGGVKIGQGGTLDPLADGVLIMGIGKATKLLQTHLDGPKTYRATALLGAETDSYDSEGRVVRTAPWKHVTRQQIEGVLDRFRGDIAQLPPIYSALKMDGKPLYWYAREGKKLPRPIEPRKVTVFSLECIDWQEGAPIEGEGDGHHFNFPANRVPDQDKETMKAVRQLIVGEGNVPGVAGELLSEAGDLPEVEEQGRPPTFKVEMRVSGGTYVRSLIHDIGHAVGSAAHVVTLSRIQQGEYHCEEQPGDPGNCVPWSVFQKAIEEHHAGGTLPAASGEWVEWEEAILDKMKMVE